MKKTPLIVMLTLLFSVSAKAELVNTVERAFNFSNGTLIDQVTGGSLTQTGNVTLTTDRSGVANNALQLNGTNRSLGLDAATSPSKLSEGMAVSFWFKFTGFSTTSYLFDNRVGDEATSVNAFYHNGNRQIYSTVTQNQKDSYSANLGVWNHYFFTTNNGEGLSQIIVNGVIIEEESITSPLSYNVLGGFALGSLATSDNGIYRSSGAIDDLVILSGENNLTTASYFYNDANFDLSDFPSSATSDVSTPMAATSIFLLMMGTGSLRKKKATK